MLETLRLTLEKSTSGLAGVVQKRLFGCDGFFAEDQIFGLIWKKGRIGLKFPDETTFCELMKLKGSDPWKAGDRTMAHWVLVPEHFHEKPQLLDGWVKRAHAEALARSGGKKKKTATSKAKATAACAPKRRLTRKTSR